MKWINFISWTDLDIYFMDRSRYIYIHIYTYIAQHFMTKFVEMMATSVPVGASQKLGNHTTSIGKIFQKFPT